MTNYRQRFYLVICLICGLLSSCSSENKDLKAYILKIKQRPVQTDNTTTTLELLPNFSLSDKSGGRNPFVANTEKERLMMANKSKNPKYLLPQCALNTIKFVGLLRQDTTLWALIQQPNGEIIRAELGNHIGAKQAKIVAINEDSIQLEEILTESGKSVKHHIALQR